MLKKTNTNITLDFCFVLPGVNVNDNIKNINIVYYL